MAFKNQNNKKTSNASKVLFGVLTSQNTCDSNADVFCYVCGQFDIPKNRKLINENIKQIYKDCFDFEIVNQNEKWVPHTICSFCYTMLTRWNDTKQDKHLKFKKPTLWKKQLNRED